MSKFQEMVNQAIREFIPKKDAEGYEEQLATAVALRAELDEIMSEATAKSVEKVFQTAYDFAIAQMAMYATAMKLLIAVRSAHEAAHTASAESVKTLVQERDELETRKPEVGEWTDRTEWIEDVKMLGEEFRLKMNTEGTPLRIALKKIETLVKALAHRSIIEFPPKPIEARPGLKVSDHVIQRSASELIDLGARHFASTKQKVLQNIIDQKARRAEAVKRREVKKKQRALEKKRLKPIFEARRARKEAAKHEQVESP